MSQVSVPGWLYARRRRLWLAAFVLLVVVALLGFWRVETTARTAQRAAETACEEGNRHRRYDLPDAFETFARQLGTRLDATPAEIDEFVADMRADLDHQFPAADC